MPSSNFYFYKLVTDNGGAPCVWRQLLSLAICKPKIRSTAQKGDLIFGFAANNLGKENRLIYVAKVTDRLVGGQYYTTHKYHKRPDCIYRLRKGRFIRHLKAKYHDNPRSIVRDLGRPPGYRSSTVILSNDFRYFGKNAVRYEDMFPLTRAALKKLKQGHRVNHPSGLRQELEELWEYCKTVYPKRKNGVPHDSGYSGSCHVTDGEGVC